MKERFQLNYDFIDQSNDDRLSEATMKELLRPKEEKQVDHCNDFDFRDELLNSSSNGKDCLFVELANVRLFHTSVGVMGLQAEYRAEYSNSNNSTNSTTVTLLHKGPMHYFAKGCFSFYCGPTSNDGEMIKLNVSRKESIVKVRPERSSGEKGLAVFVSHLLPSQTLTI